MGVCRGEEVQADLRGEDVGGQRGVEEVGEALVEDPDSCRMSAMLRRVVELCGCGWRTVTQLQVALVEALLLALIELRGCAWRRAREPAARHRGLTGPHVCDVALVLLQPQQPGRSERGACGSRELCAGRAGESPHQTGGHLSG